VIAGVYLFISAQGTQFPMAEISNKAQLCLQWPRAADSDLVFIYIDLCNEQTLR